MKEGVASMENIICEIEKKCHEKLMIYHDLLSILRKEKKSIVGGDVTALWKFSSEKHDKAKTIEVIRADIIDILNSADIQHDIVQDTFELESIVNLFTGRALKDLTECLTVVKRVKKQIQAAGKANLLFIEDYLSTINDLVDIVVGANSNTALYNREKSFSKHRDSDTVLIRREV